jgi:hypothetical protein
VLTISRLSRWSVNYYNDTANQPQAAAMDRQAASGGLGEYYSESDTRVPTWVVAGDAAAVGELTGLDAAALHGGLADTTVATRSAKLTPKGFLVCAKRAGRGCLSRLVLTDFTNHQLFMFAKRSLDAKLGGRHPLPSRRDESCQVHRHIPAAKASPGPDNVALRPRSGGRIG